MFRVDSASRVTEEESSQSRDEIVFAVHDGLDGGKERRRSSAHFKVMSECMFLRDIQ